MKGRDYAGHEIVQSKCKPPVFLAQVTVIQTAHEAPSRRKNISRKNTECFMMTMNLARNKHCHTALSSRKAKDIERT